MSGVLRGRRVHSSTDAGTCRDLVRDSGDGDFSLRAVGPAAKPIMKITR